MFIKWELDTLYDTDFEDNCKGVWKDIFLAYEKRGMNVAANMAIAFKWLIQTRQNINQNLNINDIIEHNEKDNTLYAKYKEDIEKYLILI